MLAKLWGGRGEVVHDFPEKTLRVERPALEPVEGGASLENPLVFGGLLAASLLEGGEVRT